MLKLPIYAKLTSVLLCLSIIFLILYVGQGVLIPILLSFLFAILLRPVVVFLNQKLRFPHVLAVLTAVSLFVILVALIVLFISWQVSDITEDWNKIRHNITVHFNNLQEWIKNKFNVSYNKQKNYLEQVTEETLKGNNRELMGNTLNSFSNTLLNTVLIPVYTFLILLYRNLFVKFLYKTISNKNHPTLTDILLHIKTVVQTYIVGLLIEMGIICVLTSGGLALLGVQYAILLGVITAILNLIPYIGILIAGLITILATLVNTTNVSIIIGVIVLDSVVQLIDNNFIVPKIVGDKVSINAMTSMVAVITGGVIAGIAGMFLAIPLIAILKVILDRIDSLKSWGYLMGDDESKKNKWQKK